MKELKGFKIKECLIFFIVWNKLNNLNNSNNKTIIIN